IRGFIDAHTHLMSNVGFGGSIVCGATFDPVNGAAGALKDCPSHGPDGSSALIENVTRINVPFNPFAKHDVSGWPAMKDWPAYNSLTHQQMYYKWVERAWLSGQRIMVDDTVNNNVLCEVPLGQVNKHSCEDMANVRLEVQRSRDLQTYIDNQYGGPGKGWFRIVTSPAQARKVAAQGKLAVVLGMEVSNPFGCKVWYGVPQCTRADIDAGLDEIKELGIQSMFLCHKYDNALCGVRFDKELAGVAVNGGNFINTGRWWDPGTCRTEAQDNPIVTGLLPRELNALTDFLPAVLPIYTKAPHCNKLGLTELGEYALKGMMKRHMLVELDHMSARAADRALDILEDANYPGVVSSHTWTDPSYFSRIYQLGGFIAQHTDHDGVESFVDVALQQRQLRQQYHVGYGYGMDMNGFGATPKAPEPGTPRVQYPFTGPLGDVTIDRQRTGDRVFDYNTDGVAHYGLIPDWLENIRQLGGQALVDELAHGAEYYLRTAEAAANHHAQPNLALRRATRASSWEWNFWGGLPTRAAVDGKPGTRWASGWNDREWFQVDLGRARQVGRVSIDWEYAFGKRYQIQTSTDGHHWSTAVTISDGRGGLDVHSFSPRTARYVRMQGIKRGTGWGYSIRELRVYAN
ncbi:MAG TPA: discoidin domain-containing protein, partial [Marmoricola sp.]|nr:discoidin domain-containing protein [Marmoricola sp.]